MNGHCRTAQGETEGTTNGPWFHLVPQVVSKDGEHQIKPHMVDHSGGHLVNIAETLVALFEVRDHGVWFHCCLVPRQYAPSMHNLTEQKKEALPMKW